jgi:CheY-like chemotaxis protein
MLPELQPESRDWQILLVEDEVLIRDTLAEALRATGWTVVEAGNADEAWSYLKTGAPVDLIVTDVRMPGTMNGLELADRVRDQFRQVRIIITSGGGIDLSGLRDPFLPKPFRLSQLAQLVLDSLERK